MGAQDNAAYLSRMRLAGLICLPMALRAAVELNVFEIISQAGPNAHLSPTEIIAKIPTTNPNAPIALDRILRMLAANSLLSVSLNPQHNADKPERLYGLTADSRCFVSDEDGISVVPIYLLISDKATVDSLFLLKDAVLEEGCAPFDKAHGGLNFFEVGAKEPRLNKVFNNAMGVSSTIVFNEVFKIYRGFDDVKEIVDVGGGIGTSLSSIVSRHPHIHGINFELPHVLVDAPNYPGVKHVPGDMFEGVPNAQTILLKWVLHDWNDERCEALLKNCWKALPDRGKVIVIEFVLPPVLGNNAETFNALTPDLVMMALTPGGKERTRVEFGDLAKLAGFAETRFFPISEGLHVMEFQKRITS